MPAPATVLRMAQDSAWALAFLPAALRRNGYSIARFGHVLGPVQRVIGAEWDDLAIREHVMHAAFFRRAYIEVPGVHERHDHDAEHVLVEQRAVLLLVQHARRYW